MKWKSNGTGVEDRSLAQRAAVNLQTIRYYEREGLLPEPPRLSSGYRLYTDSMVRRVRFIKRAQEIGFSLAEIRELLSYALTDSASAMKCVPLRRRKWPTSSTRCAR